LSDSAALRFLPVIEPEVVVDGRAALAGGDGRLPLAGGPLGFRQVRQVERDRGSGRARFFAPAAAAELSGRAWVEARARMVEPRAGFAGLRGSGPVLMGIVNVTPDSFSDGGRHRGAAAAAAHARRLAEEGAAIVDFGGESTRPGALEVSEDEELRRVIPAIERFRAECPNVTVSVDTRKARVARAAVDAGAGIVNDVSGLTWDPGMLDMALETGVSICVMHAQGTPAEMQRAPRYRSALLDVLEWLEARVAELVAAGIGRRRIALDPGVGFGKTFQHNMELLSGLALFHQLGCPLLVGASRKRFLAGLPGGADVGRRLPGSVAAAVLAAGAGVQILRVHDVAETAQAVAVWQGLRGIS